MSTPPPSDLRLELERAGVDVEFPWRGVLVELSSRLRNSFARGDWVTLGEAADAVESGRFAKLKHVGPKSVARVRDALEEVARRGVEEYVFGSVGRPASLDELESAVLGRLGAADRALIETRIIEGRLLRELARERGVTRERVRQIEARLVERLRYRFGAVAGELVAPVVDALRSSRGLVHTTSLEQWSAEADPGRLNLALTLAEQPRVETYLDDFVTVLARVELDALEKQVREGIEGIGAARVSLAQAAAVMRGIGLTADEVVARCYLEGVMEVRLADGYFVPPGMAKHEVIATLLLEIGRPASTTELAAAYERTRGRPGGQLLPEFGERALRGAAQYSPDVYHWSHGEYIHVDLLPMSREDIAAAVDWAVERLEGQTGRVSVPGLLDEMRGQPFFDSGWTPHVLKHALTRHPDLIAFGNALHVAHADSYVDDGLNMIGRMERVLLEAGEPRSVDQIHDELSHCSYARTSISHTLSRRKWALKMGEGVYLHRDALGLSSEGRRALLDAVEEALGQSSSPQAAERLLDELEVEQAELIRSRDDSAQLLWALAERDTRFRAGSGGLIGANEYDADNLLRQAIYDLVEERGLIYPLEIYEELHEELGFDGSLPAVRSAIRVGWKTGMLARLPGAAYFMAVEDEAARRAAWSLRPEAVVEAARHREIAEADAQLRRQMGRFLRDIEGHDELADSLDAQVASLREISGAAQ